METATEVYDDSDKETCPRDDCDSVRTSSSRPACTESKAKKAKKKEKFMQRLQAEKGAAFKEWLAPDEHAIRRSEQGAAGSQAPASAKDSIVVTGSVTRDLKHSQFVNLILDRAARKKVAMWRKFFEDDSVKAPIIDAEILGRVEQRWVKTSRDQWGLRRECQMCGVCTYDDGHLKGQQHQKNLRFNASMDALLGPSSCPRINNVGLKAGAEITAEAMCDYWGKNTHLFHRTLALKRCRGFMVRLGGKKRSFVPASALAGMNSAIVSYAGAHSGVYSGRNKVKFWHELPAANTAPKDHTWWPIALLFFADHKKFTMQDFMEPAQDGADEKRSKGSQKDCSVDSFPVF